MSDNTDEPHTAVNVNNQAEQDFNEKYKLTNDEDDGPQEIPKYIQTTNLETNQNNAITEAEHDENHFDMEGVNDKPGSKGEGDGDEEEEDEDEEKGEENYVDGSPIKYGDSPTKDSPQKKQDEDFAQTNNIQEELRKDKFELDRQENEHENKLKESFLKESDGFKVEIVEDSHKGNVQADVSKYSKTSKPNTERNEKLDKSEEKATSNRDEGKKPSLKEQAINPTVTANPKTDRHDRNDTENNIQIIGTEGSHLDGISVNKSKLIANQHPEYYAQVEPPKTTKELFGELEKSLNKSLHSHKKNLSKASFKDNDLNNSKTSFRVHENSPKTNRKKGDNKYPNNDLSTSNADIQNSPKPNIKETYHKKRASLHSSADSRDDASINQSVKKVTKSPLPVNNRKSSNYAENSDLRMDTNPCDNDYLQLQALPKPKQRPSNIHQPDYKRPSTKRLTSEKTIKELTRKKSEVESFEKVFETYDKTKETDEYKRLLAEQNRQEKKIFREKYSPHKWEKYDIQNMIYNLGKEYSHIKIVNNGTFMQRMTFDNFKRQTRDKRLNKMLEKNTAKIEESEKIKTFNRLIEDANRRLEAKEKLEAMKEKVFSHKNGVERKYNKDEWLEVYQKRFQEFEEKKEKKIEEAKYLKRREEEEEERKLQQVQVHFKAQSTRKPNSKSNVFERNYDEFIKRKLKQEQSDQFNKKLERYHQERQQKERNNSAGKEIREFRDNRGDPPSSSRGITEGFESKQVINTQPDLEPKAMALGDKNEPSRVEPKPYNALSKKSIPEVKDSTIIDYGDSVAGIETSQQKGINKSKSNSKVKKEESSIVDYDSYAADKSSKEKIMHSKRGEQTESEIVDDDEVIEYDDFLGDELKDGHDHNRSTNRSREHHLNKSNRQEKNHPIERNIKVEDPIPEEEFVTNEKNFMTDDGQTNLLVIDSVKFNTNPKHKELMKKKNQFSPETVKKAITAKKNYVTNKPVIEKPKPYSPSNRAKIHNANKSQRVMTVNSFLNEDEDEQANPNIPKPTMSNPQKDYDKEQKNPMKINDIKNPSSKLKKGQNHNFRGKIFMPDFLAEKLINNLLKFEK